MLQLRGGIVERARSLPTGTVTFLFTDIEASTRLLAELGDGYEPLLATHGRLMRAAIADHDGVEVNTEGDSFFAVFTSAAAAVQAAVQAQHSLASEVWPDQRAVRVRMGLHTGEGRVGGADYVGIDVNRAARIAAAAHGGQVVLSDATRGLVSGSLPAGVTLRDLGQHRLKDLPAAEHIWQLEMDGLPAEFPSLRSMGGMTAHLPAQVSSFVGRAEVETVKELLASSRLVTLTGPGGTGKTRLSIQVAAEVASRFPDGTWFVELDAVTDADLVVSQIASTLALSEGAESPLERLIGHLNERKVLLVLDNLEQVIDAAPDVSRMVRECPGVTVLSTSRIPLHVYGEQEFPVPALSVPPRGTVLDSQHAADFEAVRLFVERASAARPGFHLDDTDAALVAEIVTSLDGLPLAIELAAARLRTLSVEALYRRLDSRLGIVAGGARDLPERQRTLRAAIEWSHDLLDQPDRRLFARFSVMSGGARVDQVESVCGSEVELGRDVFDGLESLSVQSLLSTGEGIDGDPRFAMLATIREYATERLVSSGEADEIQARHARAYLALAEEAAPHLMGPAGRHWNDRLETEHDNLRAALEWMTTTDQAAMAMRMISALWRFWQVRGHLNEGSERVAAVLALPSAEEQPPDVRARAESAAGGLAYWGSRWQATYEYYQAALAHARETGDPALLAAALYDAGFAADPTVTTIKSRALTGRPLFEEALVLYRELGDKPGEASCLWVIAAGKAAAGDTPGAIALAQESLAIGRELADPYRIAFALQMLSVAYLLDRRFDEAAVPIREALSIYADIGDQSSLLVLLADISMMAYGRGRPERRWRLAGALDRLRVETGTDLVDANAEFIDWAPPLEPGNDEERAWWAEGHSLSLGDAIAIAEAEVLEPGAPASG
jgi:predicted ATPase/class 3 adenylate cyclase